MNYETPHMSEPEVIEPGLFEAEVSETMVSVTTVSEPPTPTVSVVIPTFRRPESLGRCILALLEQDIAPGEWEILIADDGLDPATAGVVRELSRAVNAPVMHYLPVSRTQGPAAARNAGWRAAAGAIIAFTDDDTIPRPQWLREGIAAIGAGADAVTGKVIVPLPPQPTDHERQIGGLATAEFVTANCFVRRTVLKSIGGFDERYALAWREDSDLHFALLESGAGIAHAPAAAVIHPASPGPWGISMRQQRKVVFDALLYRKFPALYRERIRPVPPWHYYANVMAILGMAACLAVAQYAAAAMFALLWLALTARFCRQRLRGTAHDFRHVAEMIVTSIAIPPLAVFWRIFGALRFRVPFV